MEERDLEDLEGSAKEEVLVRLGRFEAQMNRFEQCWKEMQPGIEVDRWWDEYLERGVRILYHCITTKGQG